VKRILIPLIIIGLLASFFIWVYAPARAKKIAQKYEDFRSAFQSVHDEIDALYNHQDRFADGIKWHYVDEGAPDGEVILFLHGLPECWYSWHDIVPLIDKNYRQIIIDMKGYGRSDLVDEDYDWHTVARQIVALMDCIGIKKFYVVSHDWGSLIGGVVVNDYQDRILGFIRMQADLLPKKGFDKVSGLLKKPQFLLFQSTWIATYMMRDAGWFIDKVYRTRMKSPFKEIDRNYLVYEFSRPGVAKMNPRYFRRKNWDLGAAIDNICKNNFSFPVLQLQADSDPAQPVALFEDIDTECPNVKTEWITNASHFDNFDQPAQIADAVNRFVSK